MRFGFRGLVGGFVWSVVFLAAAGSAGAAPPFTVDSTLDEHLSATSGGQCVSTPSGVCTLRAAIEEINTISGSGNIAIPAGTYVLSLGSIKITSAPTISGAGAGSTIIDGGGVDRIFELDTTAFAYIEKVTTQDGLGTPGIMGHGHGGCIHNHGMLILVDSTVTNCAAEAGWGGGGIANASAATLTLVNDTITNNVAPTVGGGLQNLGTATLDDVTIANNSGSSAGGVSSGGPIQINNTIVANNTPDNCGATVIVEVAASGNNLDGGHSCGFAASGDLNDTDPLLETLQSDGTLPLQPGSPAIDTGDTSPANCPSADERGLARPQDGDGNGIALCDIGAYEAPTPSHLTATGVSCTPGPFAVGDSTTCRATVSDTYAGPETTPTGTVTFTSDGAGSFHGSGSCTLSQTSSGVASCPVGYTSLSPGGQTVTASYGGDGTHAAGSTSTSVTVALPASTAGCRVDGHGRITAANGDQSSFQLHTQAKPARGRQQYRDNGPVKAIQLRSLSVDAVSCGAGAFQASIFGRAKIRRSRSVEYRIDVKLTAGRSGKGRYRIRLANGYDSGARRIRRGDLQIRKHSPGHHHHR